MSSSTRRLLIGARPCAAYLYKDALARPYAAGGRDRRQSARVRRPERRAMRRPIARGTPSASERFDTSGAVRARRRSDGARARHRGHGRSAARRQQRANAGASAHGTLRRASTRRRGQHGARVRHNSAASNVARCPVLSDQRLSASDHRPRGLAVPRDRARRRARR